MKKMKRMLAMLLTVVLLAGMIPATAFADKNTQTTVETDTITVEGNNGFGTLLAAEITEAEDAEGEETAGYNVVDLTIEGNTATVEYCSLEEAYLVVALYTEDGMQLITSADTEVDPAGTTVTVDFEGDMPEYFTAKAYLVDSYDFSPLCTAYSTPMYTQEMQELLASTVNDYDESLVLNFDEDETTNFAVFQEDVNVIEEESDVNVVASVDDENAVYVIENADENVTSLTEGDILACSYGEGELLIVKVASIVVEGTTVTIQGDELEMDEAFSHVKIEVEQETVDIDTDELPEFVKYEGLEAEDGTEDDAGDDTDAYGVMALASDDTVEKDVKTYSCKFSIDSAYVGLDSDIPIVGFSGEFSGTFNINLTKAIQYCKSPGQAFLKFSLTPMIRYDLTGRTAVSFTIPLKEIDAGTDESFGISLGIYIDFEMANTGTFHYEGSMTLGASVDRTGIHKINTSPQWKEKNNDSSLVEVNF